MCSSREKDQRTVLKAGNATFGEDIPVLISTTCSVINNGRYYAKKDSSMTFM